MEESLSGKNVLIKTFLFESGLWYLAKSLGIRGTPTFLINGKLFAGALDENRLKFLIDEALSEI